MHQGVVYAATGERYRREAVASVKSLKQHMPGIHATLFTEASINESGFDEVVLLSHTHHNRLDKIPYISQVPYDQVLFLDTDTYICDDISELFALLDHFDMAMAHAPRRVFTPYPAFEDVPDSFVEFNSGVIVFRNTPAVQAMFDAWEKLYTEALESEWFRALRERSQRGHTLQDQHFLRKALYETDLRIATLPYEYNCRLMPGIVNGPVKVLHGHHSNMAHVADLINKGSHKRLITPSRTSLYTAGARERVLVPYLALISGIVAVRDRVKRVVRGLRTRRNGTSAGGHMAEVNRPPSR